MPGFRVHYIFGEKSNAKDMIYAVSLFPKSFNLGLQGPDIFFYSPLAHLLFKEHLGGQMHSQNTGAFISALIDLALKEKDAQKRHICESYICGFIGHYTLDTVVHPYVHFRTKKLKNTHRPNYTFGIHVLLETDMDIEVLHRILGLKASEFSCTETISISKKEQAVISRLLKSAVKKTYPHISMGAWQASFAISCIRGLNILLHDKKGRRKAFLRRIDEHLVGSAFFSPLIALDFHKTYKDPCNRRHKIWHNPWDTSFISRESVYDMMTRAQKTFEYRLSIYNKLINAPSGVQRLLKQKLLSSIGNLSYDTGLSL